MLPNILYFKHFNKKNANLVIVLSKLAELNTITLPFETSKILKNKNIINKLSKKKYVETFKESHGVTKKMLRSTIFSLSYFKGFSALRTKNVGETAEFIFSACKKIMNDKGEKVPKNYADVVKRTKKSNITKDNIGEIMLSQIPKISSATAKVLMNKYKTFPQLIAAISDNQKSLNDLKIVNKKGKSRKVNKTAIQNLIKFLS